MSFPATSLVSEVEADGDLATQLHTIAGDQFRKLFTTVKSYQLAEDFRSVATALLPRKKAESLIALCESESSPRVSFEAASATGGGIAG